MELVVLQAFQDELSKIAEAGDLAALQQKLTPGDILVTHQREPGLIARAFDKTVSLFQGGVKDYHSAIYVGKGQVVDVLPGMGVHKRSLQSFADRYKFKALAVKAPQEARDEAVSYAKKQLGKGYNYLGALRQAFPVREHKGERERQEELNRVYCSQLISNAYPSVPFAKKRHIGNIRPVDFQKSPLTKTIGEVR